MVKGSQLYEGKAKRVYATDDTAAVIVDYKDDATAFNGEKKGTIVGKGVINNRLSNHFFRILEKNGVPTHYIDELSERETLVRHVEIVPLEVIIRNITAGSICKRYGVEEGVVLASPSLEFSYKNDALGDPLINASQAVALGFASQKDVDDITAMAYKVNEVLRAEFLKAGLRLVDFKLEFGRFDGKIILADEISPDTCRLWDVETNQKLDKDRFRRDLGGVEEAYIEVAHRVLGE